MNEGMLERLQPHISELFRRVKRIGIAFVIVFLAIMLFNPLKMTFGITGSLTVYIFHLMSGNIGGIRIITISPFEALFTDMFLGAVISLMTVMPYIIYNIIAFVLPGMTQRERRLTKLILLPSSVMFIVGVSLAWYLVIPLMFHFTAILEPAMGIEPTVSAQKLVSFLLTIIFTLGLVFEMPLIVSSFIYLGIVDLKFFREKWRYAIVGSFIVALFISPGATGGLIETTLGLIFSGLYFSGILLGKLMEVRKRRYVYNVVG